MDLGEPVFQIPRESSVLLELILLPNHFLKAPNKREINSCHVRKSGRGGLQANYYSKLSRIFWFSDEVIEVVIGPTPPTLLL